MSLLRSTAASLLGVWLSLAGCASLETTADGTHIVPFDPGAEATPSYHSGVATYDFTLSAWTNRMPTVAPGRDGAPGFPLYVALRVDTWNPDGTPESLLVAAVSLWNTAGDSLIGAFSLVGADGSPPWVHATNPAGQSELTNDRTRPRYSTAAPDERVVPHLLLIEGGRERTLRLPSLRVTAAY